MGLICRVRSYLGLQCLLSVHGSGKSLSGNGKGGLHCVTNRLEQVAPMGRNPGTQEVEVALDGNSHRLAITFPEGGAPLDVGEEGCLNTSRRVHL
jgi:hypothetical protein